MDDSFSHIEINQHPFHTEEKRNYTIDENEKTFTKDTLNITSDNNKGKIMLDAVNEKKCIEDKIKALTNRIKKLENQEKEIQKTTGKMKEKFVIEQKIKSDKHDKKLLIESFKKYSETEIDKRKKEIEEKRKKRKDIIEKTHQENLIKNKKNYNNAKNEKIFWQSIYQDIKSHNTNMKNYQYLKIKQEFVENKAVRYKSQIDKEDKNKSIFDKKVQSKLEEKEQLKQKLKELEEKEFEYISKLKHTVLVKQQEFESFKTKAMNNSVIVVGTTNRENRSNSKPKTSRGNRDRVKCLSVPKIYKK